MKIYMDDFTAYGVTFEEALVNLEKVLKRCREQNLSLNSEKCFLIMEEGIVLGHHVSKNGIQVDPTKIEVIQNLQTPAKQKDVRSFLGHAGYYRRFIKDFSKIVSPLYALLTKDSQFEWTEASEKSFLQLKDLLTKAPVLQNPKWNLSFHIHADASDFGIGAVLNQKENSVEHAIYFISKNLQGPKLNYTITEKELLAVVYALNKFRHYVTGY